MKLGMNAFAKSLCSTFQNEVTELLYSTTRNEFPKNWEKDIDDIRALLMHRQVRF